MSITIAPTSPDFRTLSAEIRTSGLLDRRLGYYSAKVLLTVAAYAALWWGFFALGPSWATLGLAAIIGIVSTQLGFLGHDAGHRQIFASRRANRILGLLIGNGMIGLSFGWWVPKHNAHHAHPNVPGRDPDIGVGLVSVSRANDEASTHRSVGDWLARRQAQLFFPLMLLRSTGLYVSGVQDLVRRRDRAALSEGIVLAVHATLYLAVVFWVLPPFLACAFIAVHQSIFSLYLGCSFAPNHKGMALLESDAEMSFAERQVITARNISGGRIITFVFGGLNYQIEHHLFPAMPRPNLRRAQNLVRTFCAQTGLPYCNESPLGCYRLATRYLRLTAPDASLSSDGPVMAAEQNLSRS